MQQMPEMRCPVEDSAQPLQKSSHSLVMTFAYLVSRQTGQIIKQKRDRSATAAIIPADATCLFDVPDE